MQRVISVICAMVCGCLLFMAPSAFAGFGINSMTSTWHNSDGSLDLQAGSHPYEYTFGVTMNQDAEKRPEGTLRDLIVDLPAGMIGDPVALPRCSGADFEGPNPHCPGDTQVGVVHLNIAGFEEGHQPHGPVYNLVPPPGVAAEIGFSVIGDNSFQEVSVRGNDYGLGISDVSVPTDKEIRSLSETIWGVPALTGHDPERQCLPLKGEVFFRFGCASEVAPVPFLTLPTACAGPLKTTVHIDSVQEPGIFHTRTVESSDEGGSPTGLGGCDKPQFDPTIQAQPETASADSPTGLSFDLHSPQNQDPEGLATAELKNTTITLPEGLVIDPSAADGLGTCAQTGPEGINIPNPNQPVAAEPPNCPPSSKIGTVTVHTPVLDHSLPGTVYLAREHENPFGSLLALYLVVDDPITGVVVKIPGKVEPDPVTGRLKAVFPNNPELPFDDLSVNLTGGPRAPLTTPSTCGTFTTTSDLTPWTTPEGADAFPTSAFQISAGANNGPCVGSEAQAPNAPSFEAGTTLPLAGSYSPFALRFSRENGSQHLTRINMTLPPGLVGRLAGVAECSDAQLAQAAARKNPGEGILEKNNPSCPETSRVGTDIAGVGSGAPFHIEAPVYLAGPYAGAPLSLAIVTPLVAGPFDLGTIVVRAALYIDPNTAQVTVKSDPIPTILQGIPVDLRSDEVKITRPEFTLNPTSCEPMSVTGETISTQSQSAALSSRFQVGGCQGLPFKPALQASTQGKTSKANGASLTVKVSEKPGEANIHKADLTLPLALPARLTTLQKACTEAQFNTNPAGCPPESFIGAAKAITPILSVPLTGPAILVSHGGAAFPDVVFLLQANERGGTIRIDLDGKTDIKKGVTYSRFETVPDAPISSFETSLPQGPHSVLAATANLCATKLSMPTQLVGQNGAQLHQTTHITVTGCAKTKTLTRAQKLAIALKACKKKQGARRTTCERQARRRYGPIVKKARKSRR